MGFKVIHPKELLEKNETGIKKFNTWFALKITSGVGTMACAYLFCIFAILGLPAALAPGGVGIVNWFTEEFIQLVLLSIIMVGQNVIQNQNDAKAEVDHETLQYLAKINEQQLEILDKLSKS
jgi:hypothetical protein